VARANRTKFFDLVIPVVPFITHRSARDLMSDQMKVSELPVSRELIDLAAKHVADMRLIKNIHNEFVVFREKLLLAPGAMPGLKPDQLFAMILYKNVHLSDFELIRTGKSSLDALYHDSRSIVNDNMSVLDDRIRRLNEFIADPDPLQSRSESLGAKLETYIYRIVRHSLPQAAPHNLTWQFSGTTIGPEYIHRVAFRKAFLPGEAPLQVASPWHNGNFSFTPQNIGDGLGEDLSPERWAERDEAAARAELESVQADKALLAHADMEELSARSAFKLLVDGARRSFAEIAMQKLESQLAVNLTAGGYIDRNFTLYVSQYHGVHVSGQAMNFILHNVQPDVMDPHFEFDSAADVEAVLRECGTSLLEDRCIYNIAVLDYLLKHRTADADRVVQRLMAWGTDEHEFVQAYVGSGQQAAALIRRLSGFWPQTLPLVATELKLDDRQRAGLFNAAMLGAVSTDLSAPNEDVADYIQRNYRQLAALTDEAEASSATQVVDLLEFFEVSLESIAPLNAAVTAGVIERRLYKFSRDNLIRALDGSEGFGLDHILATNKHVYAYVLDRLEDYVSIVRSEPVPCTIGAPERFVAILEDVAEHDQSVLSPIVEYASPDCRVDDLMRIDEATWPSLARYQRFPLTFSNVYAYATAHGIDENIAVALLADPKIQGFEGIPEEEREALAVKILNAGDFLRDPTVRVQIVSVLELAHYLDIMDVSRERAELAGLLVAENIVEDNGAVYDALASADWSTKEFLISQSKKFSEYVTPEQLPAEDLQRLLQSALIKDAVKQSFLVRLQFFATVADQDVLQAAAGYALRHHSHVGADTLLLLAEGGIASHTIVRLLQPMLQEISPEALTAILKAMGGPYERLTSPGHQHPRLPNDPAHLSLVEQLSSVGSVSSYREERDGKSIRVSMKLS